MSAFEWQVSLVRTLGRVVIISFSSMRWLHHPFLCLLGRWFRIWYREFRIRKKNWLNGPFEILKLQWGPKSKFQNFKKKGSYRQQMTSWFQIWSQNLNRTTFYPFLAKKKRSKTGKIQFPAVFWPKRGQMLFDLNSEPRFEILSSFAAYDPFLLKLSNFDFLVPHWNFKISNGPCGHFFELEIFDVRLGISFPKDIKMGGVAIALPKKWRSQPALLGRLRSLPTNRAVSQAEIRVRGWNEPRRGPPDWAGPLLKGESRPFFQSKQSDNSDT